MFRAFFIFGVLLLIFGSPNMVASPNDDWQNSIDVCALVSAALGQHTEIGQMFLEASRKYPLNPVNRGLFLRRKYRDRAVGFDITPAHLVSRSSRRGLQTFRIPTRLKVALHNKEYDRLRAIPLFDPTINTMLYAGYDDTSIYDRQKFNVDVPNLEVVGRDYSPSKKKRLIASWTHGLTGLISHSGRSLEQLERMNSMNKEGIIPETIRHDEFGNWFPVSAVAADYRFHGAGKTEQRYSLQEEMKYQDAYYSYLAKFGLDIVAAARSGSNLLLAQANFEFSQRKEKQNPIRGMIWMGPMHPRVGFNGTLFGYLEQNVKKGVPLNPVAFDWFVETTRQIVEAPNAWYKSEFPLGENPTPVLILVGEKDLEVPQTTRNFYRALSLKFPDHVFYVEIPGAYHDVFAVTETWAGVKRHRTPEAERRAAIAWSYVYWFMKKHVLHEDAVLPPYGLL